MHWATYSMDLLFIYHFVSCVPALSSGHFLRMFVHWTVWGDRNKVSPSGVKGRCVYYRIFGLFLSSRFPPIMWPMADTGVTGPSWDRRAETEAWRNGTTMLTLSDYCHCFEKSVSSTSLCEPCGRLTSELASGVILHSSWEYFILNHVSQRDFF